jgi:hypothetical protein
MKKENYIERTNMEIRNGMFMIVVIVNTPKKINDRTLKPFVHLLEVPY